MRDAAAIASRRSSKWPCSGPKSHSAGGACADQAVQDRPKLNRRDTTIVSPVDGVVGNRTFASANMFRKAQADDVGSAETQPLCRRKLKKLSERCSPGARPAEIEVDMFQAELPVPRRQYRARPAAEVRPYYRPTMPRAKLYQGSPAHSGEDPRRFPVLRGHQTSGRHDRYARIDNQGASRKSVNTTAWPNEVSRLSQSCHQHGRAAGHDVSQHLADAPARRNWIAVAGRMMAPSLPIINIQIHQCFAARHRGRHRGPGVSDNGAWISDSTLIRRRSS